MLATDEVPRNGRSEEAEDLESLRALVIGPEQRQIRQIQARLDDPIARAREVAAHLPQAILARSEDPDLARALAPSVERAITTSVRRNPHPLAEALFPVMGPAIRRAVAAALAGMVESINTAIENSLSWRSLRWRLTAFRTGRPFAEVVLANTLLYRVEQVFLIDRTTGLLLQHVTRTADVRDADMVSGMLTAIRDFVHDSFRASGDASLDAVQVGELSVWIEQGPRAILAAVMRGTAPAEFHRTLQEALEAIHLQHAEALAAFDGDTTALAGTRPALEACLQAAYRTEAKRSRWAARLVFAAIVVALVAWAALWLRDRARWTRVLDALRTEPGIVMVDAGARNGRYFVEGLRDPLARDPGEILAGSGLPPEDVSTKWGAYQALDAPFVLERARRLLRPPEPVRLALDAGTLRASLPRDATLSTDARATLEWIAATAQAAPLLAGVSRVDLREVLQAAVVAANAHLAGRPLLFPDGSAEPIAGQDPVLRGIIQDLAALDAVGRRQGPLYVEVAGHTDSHGGDSFNVPLSRARADRVLALLDASRFPGLDLVPVGHGSQRPAVPGASDADQQRNRRVVLLVSLLALGEERPAPR